MLENEIREATSERASVFVFGERPAAVLHAVRNIHKHRATKVRLFLELLDIQAVLAGPDLPVHVAKVIATDVFAMLQELDRLAEVRAAVHPREEAFDHVPRPNFQPRDPFDRFRMQKSF